MLNHSIWLFNSQSYNTPILLTHFMFPQLGDPASITPSLNPFYALHIVPQTLLLLFPIKITISRGPLISFLT
ncbi:hypothetical protein VIGAN_08135900 [Vigna angularis var. angularis]|uniref:Uncharacterized protein n=1 Tax=Vigna angularis var. angularis TaxID=157739 RepID=A0A0S3SPN9_PHAAN|nr:hypothetical protein VIGAN_08135900 [Vigna angularis var. angularis]